MRFGARILLSVVASWCLGVQPAAAVVKTFELTGGLSRVNSSLTTPPVIDACEGCLNKPRLFGSVVVSDHGDGPVLNLFRLEQHVTVVTDITPFTGIPGAGIKVESHSTQGPSPDQTGVGDVHDTIAWGFLGGWAASGTTHCDTTPQFLSACPFAGYVEDATIPSVCDACPGRDTGTWTFFDPPGGPMQKEFTTPLWLFSEFNGATANNEVMLTGKLVAVAKVPALPMLGLGALAVSLALFARSTRRNR